MKVPKSVNNIRRSVMYALTQNLGKSSNNVPLDNPDAIKRIFISHPNKRLGNLLMLTPLLQEIERTFPNCKIDVFVRGGLAPFVFRNYPQIDRIITLPGKPFNELGKYLYTWLRLRKHKYDLALNFQRGSSSGRIATSVVRAKYRFFGEDEPGSEDMDRYSIHYAKEPVQNLRQFFSGLPVNAQPREIPGLALRLDPAEIEAGRQRLREIFPDDKPIISIFTFATGSKMFPKEWWAEALPLLKAAFPDHNLVELLPVENVSQLDFSLPSYYTKDIRELSSVMVNTKLFIGADSGIMHLASASDIPVLGLFGATLAKKYAPYQGVSCAVETREVAMQDWVAVGSDMVYRPESIGKF